MDKDKAIRSAKLTAAGVLDKNRAKTAVTRAGGQIAPSKYLPGVPRQVHAAGGYVPQAALPVARLSVAKPNIYSQQPTALDALGSLASIGKTVTGFSDTIEDRNAPPPPRDSHAGRAEPGGGMSPQAVAAYNSLLDAYGQPLTVVSDYRTPSENDAAKGAKGSQHMHGNAYDIDTSDMSYDDRLALADMAWNSGFRGFGFYDNNMHFDVGDPRSWGPSYSRDSIPDWAQGWAQERYGYADGGEVADLGQAREQKQLQTFSNNMRTDISQRVNTAMEAHQKALDAGVFDGYEVGDTLQGSTHPMRITARFMRKWKPTPMTLQGFDRMGAKPTIVEHEGQQYIPMLRYQTGKEGVDGFQEGDAYLDGVKAAGYQKMGGLRSVKADGGSVDAPQKTVKAYKLFRTKGDGKLYPLFVNAEKPVEMGKWLEAEEGPQGKAQGKVKSKLGDLAYRPGWHAGDLPMATHIGGKSDPSLKKPDYRPDNHVWAEVEMAADKDWQSVADSRGRGVKAHITDQVPLGGFYRYKTNPNMTGNWLIGGNMKVNRVLPDDEVKAINDQAGTADLPRLPRGAFAAGGAAMFEGMHEDLQNEDGTPKELWHGTPSEPFDEFKDEKLGARDAGFYGRGHYLTPDRESAEEYTADEHGDPGNVMGPLHAALKNPYVWDTSDAGSHRTLRDLQSMGIMKGQGKLEPWDNLQRHHIDPFMREMQTRGHDGVLVKGDNGLSEVVVFKPTAIKHRDAEAFDPNDPRIMRAEGGEVDDPVDLGTARLMRNFNQNSTGPTPAAEGVFNRIEDRYQRSSMAYDAAHADGVFDSVQIGDVYKYKPLPNSSPMEVVGHRMMPVERWGGEKPPKYVYHDHYPVVDLKGGGETKPYSVERMEDRDLYDRVKGKPRIVKAVGGNVDKALAITRSFTKDGRAATMQLKAKGD